MPKVHFKGKIIEVAKGSNLRKALMKNGLHPYNGNAKYLNCRGLGSCGTCAIEVLSGKVHPPTFMERRRLNFPPHQKANPLRLACQCRVEHDLVLKKHPGFWGHLYAKETSES